MFPSKRLIKLFNHKTIYHNNKILYRYNSTNNIKPENEYRHPLITRYASKRMRNIFSEHEKFKNWRLLWVTLAEIELELGVPNITQDKVNKLRAKIDDIDFKYANEQERILRHDVMAHVHTFGYQVPESQGIIHLGATSCYVQDNTDLIIMKNAGNVLKSKLLKLIKILRDTCLLYKDVPCLGYTHLQSAQLTTVGKRFGLYLQDFYMDYIELKNRIDNMPFRSIKGTTGTQASFLELFNGDENKVKYLENKITELMGFNKTIDLSGQTYTRKIDYNILSTLSGIAQSSHKMCTDIRLLSSFKEIDEPFEDNQIGSSAMAYKRNPMRSERVCSLSRYLLNLPIYSAETHSLQWMERTLDDSALRRIILPESFLCCDAILDINYNIINGIKIWENVIKKRVNDEIPFMASENILMECVKQGGNRQELHEIIRKYSMESAKNVKEFGKDNDLLDRIKNDRHFDAVKAKMDQLIDPMLFIGRAPQQINQFINDVIDPLLKDDNKILNAEITEDIKV